MATSEQRRQELQRLSPRMLIEECYRTAPWMYVTERTARRLITEAVIAAEFGHGDAKPQLAAA